MFELRRTLFNTDARRGECTYIPSIVLALLSAEKPYVAAYIHRMHVHLLLFRLHRPFLWASFQGREIR